MFLQKPLIFVPKNNSLNIKDMKNSRHTFFCCMALMAMQQFVAPAQSVAQEQYVPADEEVVDITPAMLAEYEKYEAQAQREQRDYLNAIRSIWSADSILLDTPTTWVEYSRDLMSRTVVDFEAGTVRVEVAAARGDDQAKAAVPQQLTATLAQLLRSHGSTCGYASVVDSAADLSSRPVMEGLIDLSRLGIASPNAEAKPAKRRHFGLASRATQTEYLRTNEGLSEQQSDALAGSVVEKLLAAGLADEYSSPHMLFSRDGSDPTPDGTTIDITSLLLTLTESHLDKNAAVYQEIVNLYSREYNVEPALVFAVMEQESRFNPKATSHAPAYGLMQLVPKSGGLTSYRYVYNKDQIPTASFLYVPSQNVQLGSALLHILMGQFSKIDDDACRRLCVIASYNTGAGNVSRAFTGGTKLSMALPIINRMSYSELYKHLTTKLNSSEARNYVRLVEERRLKFLSQLQ